MRCYLIPLLLAVSQCATALALRGVDIGELCTRAINIEQRSGAKPIGDINHLLTMHIVVFDTNPGGLESERHFYRCSKESGRIDSYFIDITAGSYEQVRVLYRAQRAAIRTLVGKPSFDTDSLNFLQQWFYSWRVRQLYMGPDSSTWNIGNGYAVTLVESNVDGKSWKVSASVHHR